jgi:hypothetical protein
MESLKIVVGNVKPCCKDPDNIELQATANRNAFIRHCKVCGCNHHWMLGEPGRMIARKP